MQLKIMDGFVSCGDEVNRNWPRGRPVVSPRDTGMLDLGRQLLKAAKIGDVDELKTLVSNGAPFTADWVGISPLHYSASQNHVEVTELLLKAGISRDAKNKVERTPLHVASQKGHFEIVKILLIFGAEVNARDMLRMSPLHWAAVSGNRDVVRILLDHGSYVNTKCKFGRTPLDVAESYGHHHIVKLIKEMKSMSTEDRSLRINTTRKQSSLLHRRMMQQVPKNPVTLLTEAGFSMISRRKKIGIIVNKNVQNGFHKVNVVDNFQVKSEPKSPPHCLSNIKTLQLLKDHGITMIEPDTGTVVSSAVENGQSVQLTEAGKLALSSIKPKVEVHVPKSSSLCSLGTKSLENMKMPNVQKIIKIKAEQLISLTKEKKLIFQQATIDSQVKGKICIDQQLSMNKVLKIETKEEYEQKKKVCEEMKKECEEIRKKYEEKMRLYEESMKSLNEFMDKSEYSVKDTRPLLKG